MKNITIITGGAGGMGLAVAKILGKDHRVVICDVNQEKLCAAIAELEKLDIECDSFVCDITDVTSVKSLFTKATGLGKLVSVIHTAGISPQMASPTTILKINALGTVNIIEACYQVASDGFALVNVASMSAHMFPSALLPRRAYPLAATNPELFLKKTQYLLRLIPHKLARTGMAYGISKHFVVWLSKKNAARFGVKGARLVSVSPGSIDTEMGRLEIKSGSARMLKNAALKRFGSAEEIAEVLAFCASDKASYLTGTDILCDGGVIAARQ